MELGWLCDKNLDAFVLVVGADFGYEADFCLVLGCTLGEKHEFTDFYFQVTSKEQVAQPF